MLLVVLVFGVVAGFSPVVFGQADLAASKLLAAEKSLQDAFRVVLDAEVSGANVSSLLVQVNLAAGVLAEAQNAYRTGDFVLAGSRADGVGSLVDIVVSASAQAKGVGFRESQNALTSTLVFSFVCIGALVVGLFFVWRRFKAGFLKSLGDAKVEVVLQ
jgi:hypothetical protein